MSFVRAPPVLTGPITLSGELPLLITFVGSPDGFNVHDWVTENELELARAVQDYGAVLARGFPIPDASAFSAFVTGFTAWKDLPYEDSLSFAVRLPVTDRVCTTNEGKTGGMVFHHEQAAAPKYPSRLMFYCERPATVGGGTGITPSWPIVDALAASHPDFLATCEEKGVRYSAVLPLEPDASKGVGRSWKSFFAVSDKAAAEARMRELGYEWEWTEGDVLRTRTPVLSAVRSVPGPAGPATRVFFNQMVAQALANAKEFDAAASTGPGDVAPPLLCFGDGTPVPMEPLRCAAAVGEARAVDVQWQAGDVLIADNMTVLHARRAFEGPRRVLASLVQ